MPLSIRQRPLYEVKANLFKGLAHPFRIRILELLATAPEVSVADLLAVARTLLLTVLEADRELLDDARSLPPLPGPGL